VSLTIKPKWDAVEWKETGDRIFFGMHNDHPYVKVVTEERTYIIPACIVSEFYREYSVDIINNKTGEQRGMILP
jgi:hypothetical protein